MLLWFVSTKALICRYGVQTAPDATVDEIGIVRVNFSQVSPMKG